MYGWRGRIGLLVPSVNPVLEPEFQRVCPYGVSIHSARMQHQGTVNLANLVEMNKHLKDATQQLLSIRPTVIAYGCTCGSFHSGIEEEERLVRTIEELANAPVTTASRAVVEALKELRIKRLSIATPYITEINAQAKRYFEDRGFEILGIQGMQIQEASEIADVCPHEVYRFARKSCRPGSDGLFISCTGLPTLEILGSLQEDLGIPVISASQATIWESLRLARVHAKIAGFGELLTRLHTTFAEAPI